MNIEVDGKARSIVEVGRMFGVDVWNADFTIGSTLTLNDTMHGRMLRFADACAVTVPAGLRPDFSCGWSQDGSGAVTFAASSGVSVEAMGGSLVTGGQYAVGGIAALSSQIAESATVFRLVGPLA